MRLAAPAVLATLLALLTPPLVAEQGSQARVPEGVRARAQQAAARGETVRLLVRFREDFVPEGRLGEAARRLQRERIARAEARVLRGNAGRHVQRSRRFVTIPYAVVEIDAAAVDLLAADPSVAALQIDRLERPTLIHSTALVQAAATTQAGYRGAGRTIAILDSGVDRSHAFFGGRVIGEACFSTNDASAMASTLCPGGAEFEAGPGSAAPCVGMPDCDHGTHVAGIAAGGGPDFSGVAPDAGIFAIQVFSRFDDPAACGDQPAPCIRAFTSDQIAALEYVYTLRETHDIAAVNLSLGGGAYTSQAACDLDHAARKAAIDNLRSANIATVASAGNDGRSDALTAPACISSAVSVGSTNDSVAFPMVSAFSNTAPFLSLLAPGATITSSVPGNTFGNKLGTSMAAPHVAGAWAVLTSEVPGASVSAVLNALQTTGLWLSDTNANRSGTGVARPMIQVRDALQALAQSEGSASPSTETPDVNLDGSFDLIWQNVADGYLAAWLMNGMTLSSSELLSPSRMTDPNWRIAATADMDGDGRLDLVWQEQTEGWIGIWKMEGLSLVSSLAISIERVPDTDWKIVAARDFNGDGKADLVWHHRTEGHIALWYMDGVTVVDSVLFSPGRLADTNWQIEAAADFNADGKPDLLWRHQTQGWVAVWLMDGLALVESRDLSPNRVADTNWRIAAVGDVNRDGRADIVWQDVANGWIGVWLMNGTTLLQSTAFSPERVPDTNWRIVGPK